MSQQLTLETNPHHIHSYLCTLRSVTMIPSFVIIKLCGHHFKVPSKILCQSSRYFDALIRFKTADLLRRQPDIVNIDYNNNNNQNCGGGGGVEVGEIEIIENKEDAFKNIIDKLSADQQRYYDYHQQQQQQQQQKQQPATETTIHPQEHVSLDFLFDCIIVCSKYFFDYLERFYSDEFVNKLRNDASEYAVTDIILPPEYTAADHKDMASNNNDWLSILEIYRLARVYNLDYLSCEIQELIREKRTFFLKRLRNAYYFW